MGWYNINNLKKEKTKILQKLELSKARNQFFISINKFKSMIPGKKNKLLKFIILLSYSSNIITVFQSIELDKKKAIFFLKLLFSKL